MNDTVAGGGGTPAPAAGGDTTAGGGDGGRAWLPTAYHTDPIFKNLNSVDDMAKAYSHNAKLVGLDKNEIIRKPREGAPQTEWDAYHVAIGRPPETKGYEAPKVDGIEFPEATFNALRDAAFKLGMPKTMFEGFMKSIGETEKTENAAEAAAAEQKIAAADQTLQAQWGEAYAERLSDVTNALNHFGGEKAADLKAALKKMGTAGEPLVMNMLAEIGKAFREMPGFSGGSSSGGGAGAMTPTEAQLAIKEKSADEPFMKKYMAGDPATIAEMQRLNNYAYPEAKK